MTAEQEPVGSMGEEAVKLLRAWTQDADGGHGSCSHSWCPLCQIADRVLDNPELLDQVTRAAAGFAATVRDLIDSADTETSDDE